MCDQPVDIGLEIGQAIVDHAMYVSTLAVAVLGGMVAMRHHYKLSDKVVTDWLCTFWIAVGFAGFTVFMGLVIFGWYIDLTPILDGYAFKACKEFRDHEFGDTGIDSFRVFSRVQMVAFGLLLVCSGIFVFGIFGFKPKRSQENESSSTHQDRFGRTTVHYRAWAFRAFARTGAAARSPPRSPRRDS